MQRLRLKPFPRRVFQSWESNYNRYRPREKKNYVSHSCYLLSVQNSLLGFRGAPALLRPLHFPRGPTMDGPSHYLPYRHTALKMLENTADCVQLLMQIPGTQLGVSRNCSRPRATFPCWAKLHEIITQLQVPFTVKAQRTGIAGHLERQEYNPQLTNCKELTPSLSPRIIICFGTILKHFCLFHTGLCISLELEKWESVPEGGHYSGVQGCIFFHSNTLLQPR